MDLLDGVCVNVNNSAISTLASWCVSRSISHTSLDLLLHCLVVVVYLLTEAACGQCPEHNACSGAIGLKRALL